MQRLFLLLFSFVLLFCGGCKNDIDLLGKHEEKIVCYALLDPYDTVQYVRVSRLFLGEDNAFVMAQQADSIGFPIGSLDVRIERWLNGVQMQVFTLVPDTSIPRDDGIFLAPWQVLYRGTFPVLKDGSIYKLFVKDLVRGTEVHAETPIVSDVALTDPFSNSSPLNLCDTTTIRFKFKTGVNGLRYHFKLRVHYTDQFILDTTQVSEQYFDWDLGEVEALRANGGEQLTYAFTRHNFLNTLAANIPVKPYNNRISGKIDLIFVGAATDLVTYIVVQNSNANTAADIPPFSNIEGGYGVFSCRTTNVFPNFLLDQDTRYAMHTDPVTAPLNFIR